jgi:hypothetical protein
MLSIEMQIIITTLGFSAVNLIVTTKMKKALEIGSDIKKSGMEKPGWRVY